MDEHKPVDIEVLKGFSPLDGLKRENLHALARKTRLQELDSGRVLFKEGEADRRTIYLVSGEVELRVGDRTVSLLRAGTPEARIAIGPGQPRRFTARALSDITFIAMDSELLDVLITWDQTGTYEVNEISGGGVADADDWMTVLLQTKAFHRIPPANLQALFMRMQHVACKAGETVIKQGAEGDYFYVITKGSAVVTRETPMNRDGLKLAELGVGESFGEEALISDGKRNATVTMLTDGALVRLGKADFNELLNEPLLHWVDLEHARELITRGARWLDVRLPSEYEGFHLDGAISVPLYFIRLKVKTLDPKVPYVLVCDTGRRSSAAAFLLSERGFDAYCLQGGLSGNRLGPE
ncbi:MAG TPA: cyclic nucleotide-binding domain-containing protein [Steroidobacteraceae bacterium]|nr:cyclic nucleotide-binding domain-containing protein [Steroidobacteraceae bacterium]